MENTNTINWLDVRVQVPSPTRVGKVSERTINVPTEIGPVPMTVFVVEFAGSPAMIAKTKGEANEKLRELRAADETVNATREAAFLMARLSAVHGKIHRLLASVPFTNLPDEIKENLRRPMLTVQAQIVDAVEQIPEETRKAVLDYSAMVADENSRIIRR